jgi:hypothetical protein
MTLIFFVIPFYLQSIPVHNIVHLHPFAQGKQGNNEEQAHTRNKGTNEHDWKETAISLETSINT